MDNFGHVGSHTRNRSLHQASVHSESSATDSAIGSHPPWSPDTVPDTSSRASSFLKKRFTSDWAKKQSSGDNEEGVRGPIGLQLLHCSPEPLVDIIFVHGLRGGSIKTWRKGDDPRNFWPKFWLPFEPGMHNANIHSFGYDSDWASTKSSILNVHDFGQSLLEEMRNSPHMRGNQNCPVVLIGHSMGGLVIKKAFILARHVPEFENRIRCIVFLATPHRGSDYAATLNNILTLSGVLSPRQYITDLTSGSSSAELINDEFGRYATELPIFSFYETLRMNLGISSSLVVEKQSAVLGPGFQRERAQYLNANHRDISKFDNPEDSNYVTLRNALAGAVQDIMKDDCTTRSERTQEQLKALQSYLGVSDPPGEHYSRAKGSCQWIDDREDFQDWRDTTGEFMQDDNARVTKNVSVFWVHANPGTGKTFLAAHVVNELLQFQLECAYYYFHVGDKVAHSLGDFLRSMAYQMAISNASIRRKLFISSQESIAFDKDDAGTIWSKLFKKGIFQARIRTPQYWVIDALDECSKYQELITMIKSIQVVFPLRIFITSRKIADMHRLCRSLEPMASITNIEIEADDSINDIECYIQARAQHQTADMMINQESLTDHLLRKSNACFLWVRLVLDELEQVYSKEGIVQVLQSIPEGMIPYYERTLRSMAEKKLEKHIAKAVLLWVVASTRKLALPELSHALKLHINAVLPSARAAVEGLCGQLVSVDGADIVDVVHSTAREFLLSDLAGEFTISKPLAHERIALVCLQLLSSPEMQPPRNRRLLTQRQKMHNPSALLDYAITQFSEHVYTASSENDELLLALDHFFKTNVLTWIEKIAQRGDLHPLIRVSKNLKSYLERRAKYRSPLSEEVKNVASWSTDLSRTATRFGRALLQNPTSIYFLIPPLCPSSSSIHLQFAKRPDGLAVLGHRETSWDDCISSVGFGEESLAASVSCGENLIAVGMDSGEINLYDCRSCQKTGSIVQKQSIDLVHFTDKYIAVSTTRSVILMDCDGNILWQTRNRFRCILLTSTAHALVAVAQHGHLLKWDITSGGLIEDQDFPYRNPDSGYGDAPTLKAPHVASLSPDTDLLAMGYRAGTVCVWDTASAEFICWARDERNRLVSVLLFNPNPNLDILLVIFRDHDLALYETWSGGLINHRPVPDSAGILSASSSTEGRTLATMNTEGVLQIWDFESLQLLYRVVTPSSSFRILNFSSDGANVVDVDDYSMRIWAPAALVRKNNEEDQSVSDDATYMPPIEGGYEEQRSSRITALCVHPVLPMAFAGKFNGQVTGLNARTGAESEILYVHPHTATITQLSSSKNNVIASSDANGVVQVWAFGTGQLPNSKNKTLVLQQRSKGLIKQLCLSTDGDYLLVSTVQSDDVYSLRDGSVIGSLTFEPRDRKAWRWLLIPPSREQKQEVFALLQDHSLVKYSTQKFPSKVDDVVLKLQYDLGDDNAEMNIESIAMYPDAQMLAVGVSHMSAYATSSTMFLFDLGKALPTTNSSDGILATMSDTLPRYSRQFVGVSTRTKSFVFLHQNCWVCSVDKASIASGRYTQHFFVPNEFFSAQSTIAPVVMADDSIAFCLHGDILVVKNGLSFRDSKPLS
ncbi:hypothetical protein F4778DRAFT_594863 [Xylariomycetidae sp. FL2044]|nr:hypothetical protein F4778DRAFT_594863 [Xylariomycetidae sp. FL2044]